MITPNGGVFGRNPKFHTISVDGEAAFAGGMTVTPNAAAPTSNVAIGQDAGIAIIAAESNVLIGQGAGDTITGSDGSVAIGLDALGAQTDGAVSISNTVAGSLSTTGSITNVQLVKESGTGTMSVYPIVTLTVGAGGDVTAVSVTNPGSGATVPSGIVFKTTDARIDPAWRGTLSVVTRNTAIGRHALRLTTTAHGNTATGAGALASNTTGTNNSALGDVALISNTTGSSNVGVGRAAMQVNTTGNNNTSVGVQALLFNSSGSSNCAIGQAALFGATTGSSNSGIGASCMSANTTGSSNSALGAFALSSQNGGSNNVAVGVNAGRYRGASPSTNGTTSATSSVFIGYQSRAAGNAETNQVVIGGVDAVGDGSDTTVLNNSSTTSTRIAGTATSVLRVDGDTVRIVNDKTPASAGAAGNEGDICWDANYLYVCVAANTWKRVAIATWP